VELATPEYLVVFNADSGKLAELRQFGVAGSAENPVDADGAMLGSLPNQTSVEDEERLWLIYDALLPSFAAGTRGVPWELRASADEFRSLFGRLMEPPLSGHYRTLGHAFMAWLETDEP
jgi:hypothetical protein